MDGTTSESTGNTSSDPGEGHGDPARRLGGVLEPVIGQVYFSPECHRRYAELGFEPSPGDMNGVALPDGPAYFTSRGSLLGQVPGQVVAAAFAVFNPDVVVPAVAFGWTMTDAETVRHARDQGAMDQLERILGPAPDGLERVEELLRRAAGAVVPAGRPLAAGLLAMPVPDHRFGTVFRLGDRLREFRGDCHTAAWIAAGLSAVEIGLLTELYWGLPLRTYSRTRGWTEQHYDDALQRLRSAGLIEGDGFSDRGRALREKIEADTDRQLAPVIEAVGDDANELISLLEPWGAAIRSAKGYPESGPHELAARGGSR